MHRFFGPKKSCTYTGFFGENRVRTWFWTQGKFLGRNLGGIFLKYCAHPTAVGGSSTAVGCSVVSPRGAGGVSGSSQKKRLPKEPRVCTPRHPFPLQRSTPNLSQRSPNWFGRGQSTAANRGSWGLPHTRLATSIRQLRHDQMEQGPTEPHAGRSTCLLSSGGAGGGYY